MNLDVRDLLSIKHINARNLDALRKFAFKGVCTDSREMKSGELFVALRGEKFDGHNFVRDAMAKGAACAIVDREFNDRECNTPLLVVPDTTKALGELAGNYRRKFTMPVIAVAGSNGKTTTKEMIALVLATQYSVLSTQGNLNNHIGVPQTLFRLRKHHDIAVIEIGTNHFGELKYLCGILEPTHGLITNIGHEHLEFFKTLSGVARAEGELYAALANDGVGFVNADDALVVHQSSKLRKKKTYGFAQRNVHVRGTFQKMSARGCATFSVKTRGKSSFDVQLSMPGKHAMANALAASAVGGEFKVDPNNISRALKNFKPVSKRMEVRRIGKITIVNDTYNANPDSVLSALETVRAMQCAGKRIVILADMLELGEVAEQEHERVGAAVGSMGFEYLLTYGQMAKSIHEAARVKMKFHYEQKNVLAEYAVELCSAGDIILVKGSRGMKMEDVVEFLDARLRNQTI